MSTFSAIYFLLYTSGQTYTARIAPHHLNVFLNLGNLLAKNDSRLMEADAVSTPSISTLLVPSTEYI